MKLTNKQYDLAKKVLTVGVPGITAFIVTLGGLYGFSTEIIVGTITAAATLAGVFLNIASSQYQDEEKPDYGDGQEFTEKTAIQKTNKSLLNSESYASGEWPDNIPNGDIETPKSESINYTPSKEETEKES
ncbi:phage holin [Enterococcus casseliflavus]|uniref:phage holin n=1 Tax=Enterococcus casseliflavus TaxID=37734 RepID=UPI00325AEC58